MGNRKTKPVSEKTYRQLVWDQVESELERTGQSRADLARRWGKSKSVVTRLEKGDLLPTTLGNLDSLAAALDMELGAFVWPLVQPKDAEGAAKRASAQSARLMVTTHNALARKYLNALNHDTQQRLLRVVGQLGMYAPDELPTVIDQLEGLMQRRKPQATTTQGEAT
jgi:transcriptional regulator with XRE-family HTH domain